MFPNQTRLEYCDTCGKGYTYMGYDLNPAICTTCNKSRLVFHDFHGRVEQDIYDKKLDELRKLIGRETLNMNDDEREEMEESDYNPLREVISQQQTEIEDLTDQVSDLTTQLQELIGQNESLEVQKERLEDALTDIQAALRTVI